MAAVHPEAVELGAAQFIVQFFSVLWDLFRHPNGSQALAIRVLMLLCISLIMFVPLLAIGYAAKVGSWQVSSVSRRILKTGPVHAPGQASMKRPLEGEESRFLWHLLQEVPFFGQKATRQLTVESWELPDFILRHWSDECGCREEVVEALIQQSLGKAPADGWWNWIHRDPFSVSMCELMAQYHCDGLLDWSRVSASALRENYLQLVVTSGLGPKAMLHEDEGAWLTALHQDVFCDASCRGMWSGFHGQMDTLIVGLVGRKRVVMLPPNVATPYRVGNGSVDLWCCAPPRLRELSHMPLAKGWEALEQYARDVGGLACTVCPSTFCLIPSGWWHIVRPLDEITAALSPSFVSGCWRSIDFRS